MSITILGTNIHNLSLDETLDRIRGFLNGTERHQIVTTNPEFIMAARKDDAFRHILNSASLSVADGMGVVFAARRYGQKLKQRITGVDLMERIVHMAEEENKSIFLLGSKRGVPERAAEVLKERYPELDVAGAECGYRRWHRPIKDHKLVHMINRRKPDIVFVAFGQVKQEKWIYHNLPQLKTVRVAMGVGGSFDYLSKNVRRAPAWMRRLGLEWLFRVARQPWRLPRIVTAVAHFSLAVLFTKSK